MIRSQRPQLVPFKPHRFGKQRLSDDKTHFGGCKSSHVDRRKITLPPLSYSSQHAAFNLIVRAVGHYTLQLLVLVDADNGVTSHCSPGIPDACIAHILDT